MKRTLHPGVTPALSGKHPGDIPARNSPQPGQRQHHMGKVLAHPLTLMKGLGSGGMDIRRARNISHGCMEQCHHLLRRFQRVLPGDNRRIFRERWVCGGHGGGKRENLFSLRWPPRIARGKPCLRQAGDFHLKCFGFPTEASIGQEIPPLILSQAEKILWAHSVFQRLNLLPGIALRQAPQGEAVMLHRRIQRNVQFVGKLKPFHLSALHQPFHRPDDFSIVQPGSLRQLFQLLLRLLIVDQLGAVNASG